MYGTRSVQKDSFDVALIAYRSNSQRKASSRTFAVAVTVLGTLLATSRYAHAQQAASAEFQTAVPLAPLASPSGPNGPFGVALDKSGNLFVTDYTNSRVLEVPAGCSSVACQVTVPATGLNNPTAVTVDSNGNVFVADYHNNRILEVPWNGSTFGPQITLPTTGQNLPTGLAVDIAGDLFIANNDYTGTTTSRVVELPWNGSSYGTPITIVNWLGNPSGLAIDGAGNLFVTDVLANQVVELPKGCASSSCQTIVTSGVSTNDPGVATDATGNVYVAYFGGNRVLEIPSGCSSAACQIQIGYGLNEPAGVAVDAKGTIYIADYQNGQVEKVQLNSVDFGTVKVGSVSTVAAHFVFNSSTTLNSSSPYSVLTQGASGLEFLDAGSSTCSAMLYSAGQTCIVEVNFAPARAGFVAGALVLSDSSGKPVATAYLHGIGSGPQLTFTPGSKTLVGSGLGSSTGIAIDRKANIYVADSVNRTVDELLAPSYTTTVPLGGGFSFSNPVSLAVDGAGNVFVADSGSSEIDEILAPSFTTVKTLGSGFNSPSGIAVDGSGNVFVADTGNNAIKEIREAGGYVAVNAFASSFSGPTGIAVDGNGSVYISDTGNSAVKEIVAVDGNIPNSPAINTLATGFSEPFGLAIDAATNLYVADKANDTVYELTAANGYTAPAATGDGFGGPSGIALDRNGNLYVGSSGNNQVAKLDLSDPPSLNFTASVGATSNPQGVTFSNIGNADLTFATPGSGTNPNVSAEFAIQSSGGSASSCPIVTASSGPTTLSVGTSCKYELTFSSSTGGTFSGSLIATDNNLNAPGSTQAITLTGQATAITIAPASLSSAQVGVAYNQAFSASGGVAPYTFSVTGSLPAGISFNAATATVSGTPTAAGTFPISVSATDSSAVSGPHSSTVNYTLTVSPGTAVLTFAPIPPQTYGNSPFEVTATSASAGIITYSIVSGPALINPSTGVVTLNGAGQVTIQASQTATSSYNAVVAQTPINVARQKSVTSLTVNPLLISLGQKVTLTATVGPYVMGTPSGTVTFYNGSTQIGTAVALIDGTATLVSSSLPTGLDVISADYSGDSNFLRSNAAFSSPIVVVRLDFSFLAAGKSSQTVLPGGVATFDFTLAPSNTDYPGTVTFSVDGLPAGAKTTINPTNVSSTAGLQTVKLTIHSPTGSAGPILTSQSNRPFAPFALALFVPLFGLRRIRRKCGKRLSGSMSMILLSAVCLVTWPLSGCGAVSGVLGHSYSVAVTATSGNMQHTAYVSFVVN